MSKKQIKTKHRKNSPTNKTPSRTASLIINSNFTSPLPHSIPPLPFPYLPPYAASYPSLSSHFSYRFASLPVENLTLQHLSPPAEKYWSMMAYNNVKLCNVLFAQELAQVSHDPLLGEISLPLSLFVLHSSLFSSAGNIVAYRSARCILATWSPRSCHVTIGSIACSLL